MCLPRESFDCRTRITYVFISNEDDVLREMNSFLWQPSSEMREPGRMIKLETPAILAIRESVSHRYVALASSAENRNHRITTSDRSYMHVETA